MHQNLKNARLKQEFYGGIRLNFIPFHLKKDIILYESLKNWRVGKVIDLSEYQRSYYLMAKHVSKVKLKIHKTNDY